MKEKEKEQREKLDNDKEAVDNAVSAATNAKKHQRDNAGRKGNAKMK